MNKYQSYQNPTKEIPTEHSAWPLYGAGVESLGKNGKPVERPVPAFSDDELLMRIDAVSLCYTDVKEIKQGPNHPRLTGRDLTVDPIVPGHEICMTVVAVGKNLADSYQIGDRYTMQPDVWVDGKSIPFCFGMDGGYRQYAKIGAEILQGDAGNYLIPIPDDMSYAASAITEPWACVEAAYRMQYRTKIADSGSVWVIGGDGMRSDFDFTDILKDSNPGQITVTNVHSSVLENLKTICEKNSIPITEIAWSDGVQLECAYDDVIALDCSASMIDQASKKIAKNGILALLQQGEMQNKFEMDLGRLHYDNILFVGSEKINVADAYQQTPARVTLKENGIAWILGAGGPMGRMHLQRAIESKSGPRFIIASEVTQDRFASLKDFFEPLAQRHEKELVIIDPVREKEEYESLMAKVIDEGGVDDIEVMVAVAPVIEDAPKFLAKDGVMNLFAGLKRGVCGKFDAGLIYGPRQARYIGHSGSALADQRAVVDRSISGELKPELSVAAVGGFNQIADGIRAMKEWIYPGKIVIYPHVPNYPLTALYEFEQKDQEIYEALGEGSTWTARAESIFLDKELD